jgi:hypothetical protein
MTSTITLHVKGQGHVVSKKNSKMITHGRLITKPDYQHWTRRVLADLESQCWPIIQTCEGATSMERVQQFLTCSLPCDDNWQVVPELILKGKLVPKGMEGAEILIEPL